jgi:glycosyltransferase involved in cell wall biosynthesis
MSLGQPETASSISAAAGRPRVSVIIPALNEDATIEAVVRGIPAQLADEIIVADNGSIDSTAERARHAGARVILETKRGYGRACRAGVLAATESDILVFLDGDGSDCPELMERLLGPILAGTHDFVIGSRLRGQRDPGSMNAAQILAGRIAGVLLRLAYGATYSDMGPFRAIRSDALASLGMKEQTYGWNLEMQMRAAQTGLRILEVPVDHRRRAGGKSKVSGNVLGTMRAAMRILFTFVRVLFAPSRG